MKLCHCRILACLSMAAAISVPGISLGNDLFVTRTALHEPARLHQAVRDYAKARNWVYVGDNLLKKGEVIQVRLCIAEAASDIWTAGMHVAAMLPCGHFAIYREDGRTRITMLHPSYMTRLDPSPVVARLAENVAGPFLAMLEETTRD